MWHIATPLLVVWDGLPSHQNRLVRDFVADTASTHVIVGLRTRHRPLDQVARATSPPSGYADAQRGPSARRPPRPCSGPRAPGPPRSRPGDDPSPRPPSPGTTSGSRAARPRFGASGAGGAADVRKAPSRAWASVTSQTDPRPIRGGWTPRTWPLRLSCPRSPTRPNSPVGLRVTA